MVGVCAFQQTSFHMVELGSSGPQVARKVSIPFMDDVIIIVAR